MSTNFVIVTKQDQHHEWMAFACWYSIHRNCPESKVAVVFPRAFRHHQFTWLNKCHVPYLACPADSKTDKAIEALIDNNIISPPLIVIQDHQMVIREIGDVEGIVQSESLPYYSTCSDENGSIVDYQLCGKFNLTEWVEKENKHPFYHTGQLVARNRTVNEQKVLKLWKQMGITFDFINR